MVLHHIMGTENVAQYVGRLHDDAREWDSNNDALFTVSQGMIHCPDYRRDGLSAPGRHGELKEPRLERSRLAAE